MISLVICHRDADFLEKIKINIKDTIGVPYELIIIDNTKNQYSIFEAYNYGVSKCNYDIICFTHEDILFHTLNWGVNVIEHFKDESIGMIGICGGDAMPNVPAPWWNSKTLNNHYFNNINTWKGKESYHQYSNPFDEKKSDVVLLDGAWFCIPKNLFKKITFDTKSFKGFHCYDSDISLQVLNLKRVVVIYDVLLEHFSAGTINHDWVKSTEILADKWIDYSPRLIKEASKEKISKYNNECLLTYCYWLQSLNVSDLEIRSKIKKYLFRNNPKIYYYHTYILLYLWQLIGYKTTKYLYFPINLIKKLK